MFSLNGAVKYKYVPNYQDMRGGYILQLNIQKLVCEILAACFV